MNRLTSETVKVNLGLLRLRDGGVEIDVTKVGPHLGAVVLFPSTSRVREVLLAFGLSEKEVERSLGLLANQGTNQRVLLPQADVPLRDLWAQGFKV
jgi:hypothetical protein